MAKGKDKAQQRTCSCQQAEPPHLRVYTHTLWAAKAVEWGP